MERAYAYQHFPTHDACMRMTPAAAFVLEAIEDAGHTAWLVGGCVRDALMGLPAHDTDMATSAPWQAVRDALAPLGCAVHETGTAHGTVTVVARDEAIEITTYRTEGGYSDARHPDSVTFVDDIELDLARRDFTINAMAYHPRRGLLDPYGGATDIALKTIRAVGDADARMQEDPLRIMRAIRFASQLGFSINSDTREALSRHAGMLESIAAERIQDELFRTLRGPFVETTLFEAFDVMRVVLPETAPPFGVLDEKSERGRNALKLVCRALGLAPRDEAIRLAILFIGSTAPLEEAPALDAGRKSAATAARALRRLRAKKSITRRVCRLAETYAVDPGRSNQALRFFIASLGGDEALVRDALLVKHVIAQAEEARGTHRTQTLETQAAALERLIHDGTPFTVSGLALDGLDLIMHGVPRGPLVGLVLEELLVAVLDGTIENDKALLIGFIPAALERAAKRAGRKNPSNENIFQKRLKICLTSERQDLNITTRACDASQNWGVV